MSTHKRPSIFEHDGEPIPGLPEALPEGESILWQGAPGWAGIARRALHLRGLALYFALLGGLRGAALAAEGADLVSATLGGALMIVVGAVPIGLLAGFALLSARTSLYTITNRRIVLRIGVALPMTINLPFALIDNAGLAKHADGTGDITVTLAKPHRIAWLAVWPHTRSFRIARPEPTLRAVSNPDQVAQILSRALSAHAAMPVTAMQGGDNREAARPGAAAMA